MDEKSAIDKAVQSRLAILRGLRDPVLGTPIVVELIGVGAYFPALPPQVFEHVEAVKAFILRNVVQASTFVLNEEECDTVIGSHETFPSTIAHASEIITPEGFVYFAKPIPDPTKRPPLFPIRAMSWSVTHADEAVVPLKAWGDVEERYTLTITVYTDTTEIGGTVAAMSMLNVYPIGFNLWGVGVENGAVLFEGGRSPDGRFTDERVVYVRILLAFFALMQSDVLREDASVERPKKASTRLKAARQHHPELNSKIKVVRYRKRSGSGNKLKPPSASGRTVGVRYWRAPFWKWVWYPSLGDNRLRRIEPFLSGPEDAPIVGADRVFRTPKGPKAKPVHDKSE